MFGLATCRVDRPRPFRGVRCFASLELRFMHDRGGGLRRITSPRTRVNRGELSGRLVPRPSLSRSGASPRPNTTPQPAHALLADGERLQVSLFSCVVLYGRVPLLGFVPVSGLQDHPRVVQRPHPQPAWCRGTRRTPRRSRPPVLTRVAQRGGYEVGGPRTVATASSSCAHSSLDYRPRVPTRKKSHGSLWNS